MTDAIAIKLKLPLPGADRSNLAARNSFLDRA
jgi:hypothetical protein